MTVFSCLGHFYSDFLIRYCYCCLAYRITITIASGYG